MALSTNLYILSNHRATAQNLCTRFPAICILSTSGCLIQLNFMKVWRNMLKLLFLATAILAVNCSDVIDLGDSDFDSRLADMDMALVKFYAPWCGHCKSLAPEFDKAATALKGNDPPISLVKVDCTAEGKSVCDTHGVKGFPTLKAFKNGEVAFEYQGPRDAAGIVKYMKSKAGPTSKKLESEEMAESFIGKPEIAVIGFFEKEGSDLQKAFQKVADALGEDFKFGYSYDKDVLKKYGHKEEVVIYQPEHLHNKFEDKEFKYDGEAKVADLKQWVNDNIHGLAGHRTSNNADQFKRPVVVAYYEVDYVKNTKGTNYWRNRVMKVAKKIVGEGKSVYFAVSSKEDFSHELSEMGLPTDKDTPVVAARDSKDRKFVMTDDFSMDTFEKFVRAFLNDELEAYMKSEPVPSDNSAPVKVLVSKNFDEIVSDDKDVLIEFYAPWCGHCKTLAPKYDELAEKLKDETDIVIAKMDATANDVPKQFEVSGFPTLFFSPKGSKASPKKYNGGREVDDFIKYLAKEATNQLKGWDRNGKKLKKKAEL